MLPLRARYFMKYDVKLIYMLAIVSIVSVRALPFVHRDACPGKTRFASQSHPLVPLPLPCQSEIEIDIDFLEERR